MLLSICIPTYNRCEKVLSLLRFLSSEIEGKDYIDDIEIIISDNCSTDNTQERLVKYTKSSNLFIYHRNKDNLGLIGNLHKLAELSKGEYIWFMGDDDKYHEGIIGVIYNNLKKSPSNYLFINHCAYKDYPGDGTGFMSAIPNGLLSKQTLPPSSLLKIFNHSGTSLMFISASVFNRETIMGCDCTGFDNLALPLYWSFYCASKGVVSIIPDVYVENQWGEVSWSGESKRIFSEYIPNIFRKLPELGYNRIAVNYSLLKLRYRRSELRVYVMAIKRRLKYS